MSGFEIAGVVLAVLPFFIEAGKAYAQNVGALQKATSRAKRDEKLSEFYEMFWWETFELRKQIEKAVNELPNISPERKRKIIDSRDLDVENWAKATDVAQALKDFLASEDDYLAFQKVMEKVLSTLTKLIEDDTVHIKKSETNQSKMLERLKRFQNAQLSGNTTGSFWERFRFWKKEKDRNTCLQNLRTWNSRVRQVVSAASEAARERKAVAAESSGPSSRLRILSKRLFTALSNCWNCNCTSRHEARFCLASCGNRKQDPSQCGIHFDFLVSHWGCQTSGKWREGKVTIKPASIQNSLDRAELGNICDTLQLIQAANISLQLLIEDLEVSQRIWRLSWQESCLDHLDTAPALTFEMMLQNYNKPSLIARRKLALIFAYSLIQLHESPWLSRQWNKDRIYFFYASTGGLDLRRPYISTDFEPFPLGREKPDLDRFHRHLGLLKLGILLIEAHTWKPIESFRVESDLKDGEPTPNTDMGVARRVLGVLDDCFPTYQGAIEACIRVPWVSGGSRVSLEDLVMWNGVYRDIVEPLEREVALGGSDVGI